jgi:hypothetical protein
MAFAVSTNVCSILPWRPRVEGAHLNALICTCVSLCVLGFYKER